MLLCLVKGYPPQPYGQGSGHGAVMTHSYAPGPYPAGPAALPVDYGQMGRAGFHNSCRAFAALHASDVLHSLLSVQRQRDAFCCMDVAVLSESDFQAVHEIGNEMAASLCHG